LSSSSSFPLLHISSTRRNDVLETSTSGNASEQVSQRFTSCRPDVDDKESSVNARICAEETANPSDYSRLNQKLAETIRRIRSSQIETKKLVPCKIFVPQWVQSAMPRIIDLVNDDGVINPELMALARQAPDTFCFLCQTVAQGCVIARSRDGCWVGQDPLRPTRPPATQAHPRL
jgi:hypothetical protein